MATKPKRARDLSQLAKQIVDIATGEVTEPSAPLKPPQGRAGGLKGGVVRAKKLSAKERSDIAKKAAAARWKAPSEA
jgi:hypothetical protein